MGKFSTRFFHLRLPFFAFTLVIIFIPRIYCSNVINQKGSLEMHEYFYTKYICQAKLILTDFDGIIILIFHNIFVPLLILQKCNQWCFIKIKSDKFTYCFSISLLHTYTQVRSTNQNWKMLMIVF